MRILFLKRITILFCQWRVYANGVINGRAMIGGGGIDIFFFFYNVKSVFKYILLIEKKKKKNDVVVFVFQV